MPKAATHLPVVRQWCQSLGVLSAVSISRQEAELKLAAYVPLLVQRFPDAAFSTASLEYIAARAAKGFPTYGELAGWLSDWWRENRPPLPALAAPPPPPPRPPREPLTPDQLAELQRVTRETVAWLRSSAQPDTDRRPAGPRYLSPQQLDAINPLPDGRKRHHGPDAATVPPEAHDAAAPVDPDPARAA